MGTFLRQFIFILVGIVLRWPFWLLIGIAGKFGLFRFVFLVYPTDEVECGQFCPNIPIFRRFLSGRPTPGGLIANGWRPVGIYFVVPDLPRDLARKQNRQLAENIVNRMRWIRRLAGAETIGLAGQLGPIFSRRHNIVIEPPLFSSINGNIFSIHEAVKWAALQHKTFSKQTKVAIVGGGELGQSLHEFLGNQGLRCNTIDVRFTRQGNAMPVTSGESIETLNQADMIINLLPKGEDFMASNLPSIMREKASIVDFSRPAIDKDSLTQNVYMGNRLQKSGMRYVMALPGGWSQKQLPACSLPAMLAALTGEIHDNLESFCVHAGRQAFTTALIGDIPVRVSGVSSGKIEGELAVDVS